MPIGLFTFWNNCGPACTCFRCVMLRLEMEQEELDLERTTANRTRALRIVSREINRLKYRA
jgi:hypothetical protein